MSFEQTISKLVNIEFLQDYRSPSIKQYRLPSQTGEGICRIIQLGRGAVMIVFYCEYLENYTCCVQDEDLIHISYYLEVHSTQHCPLADPPLMPDTFYAHLGLCGKFHTVYEEHTPVKSIHIFLAPEYYDTYLSEKIPDCGMYLKEAIAMLNQMEYFPELSLMFHQIYRYQAMGVSSLLFYESKLTEILAMILQKSSDCKESLSRHIKQADIDAAHQIAEYITAHATQEISLTSLAHMAYMSPAKLKYVFKSVFHCSIRDYRLQKRMCIAKEFLYHTDLSISDVANRLGYQTSGSFSAIFKKYTGFSPRDYRIFSRTTLNKKISSQ